jgi:hypothetical protein
MVNHEVYIFVLPPGYKAIEARVERRSGNGAACLMAVCP